MTTCGQLKSATGKTVRASTPYPPVLEPGIEDWLIVWRLESARAHGGLTELGNADLTDTQIRALRRVDCSFSTFGKTMPFFGNILPTLRSYSGIEYPPGQRLRLHFAFAAERLGYGLRADAATSRVLNRDRRQGRRAAGGGGRRRGRAARSTRSTDARRWSSSPRKWRSFRRSTCRCSRWRVVRGKAAAT